MNKKVLVPALLSCAFALPFTACADTMDDFVMTSNGLNITFTLPASPPGNESVCPITAPSCLPGSETSFSVETLVTTNGVSAEEPITFPTSRFGGGMDLNGIFYISTNGRQLFAPDAANPTFVPGTYSLGALFGPVPAEYMLTITPESTTVPASTPEPSTMALFGTGVLGLIGVMRNRRAVNGRLQTYP